MLQINRDTNLKILSNRKLKRKTEIIISQKYIFLLWKSLPMTTFWNLVDITFQKIVITFFPKEFGTLPHVKEVTLLENCFINTFKFTWEWLEQIPIKFNLSHLNMGNISVSSITP